MTDTPRDSGTLRYERARSLVVDARSRRRVRVLLFWSALLYTCFVIYGSLVPLDFHRYSLDFAWTQFQQIATLNRGIGSRADWVANILLFIPLVFLWLGALWPRSLVLRPIVLLLVLSIAAVLSACIEFTQIFFPPRTVSLDDIIAESTGAVVGAITWCIFGPRITDWLVDWSASRPTMSLAKRLLLVYLFLLFGYNLMPLDLTISVVEIYHKWNEGKIIIVPFSHHYESTVHMAYALAVDIAVWIPAAMLWRVAGGYSVGRVVGYVVASAALIEILQLFVYSRTTSTTDVIAAGLGAMFGAMAARPLLRAPAVASSPVRGHVAAIAWWLAALCAWTAVVIAVFWFPFNFNTEWGFVHARIAEAHRVPLAIYYYGTEFRALTEVFHKVGFFFPFGALAAMAAMSLEQTVNVPRVLLHVMVVLASAGLAAGIELGQLFLPDKIADATDWFFEASGGIGGYILARMVVPALGRPRHGA